MHVRYTGGYPGMVTGYARWQPGEVREVSDDVGAFLLRGDHPFWERVETPVQDTDPGDEETEATTPRRRSKEL